MRIVNRHRPFPSFSKKDTIPYSRRLVSGLHTKTHQLISRVHGGTHIGPFRSHWAVTHEVAQPLEILL